MLEKLKVSKKSRLALVIAAGVFGGLLSYRLLIATLDWFTAGWSEITSQQQALLLFAIVVSACAVAIFLIRTFLKRINQARALRAVRVSDAERHRQIISNSETLNRQTQLSKFLKWMQNAENSGISYLSPDSVMNDSKSQQVLESMHRKSTEELLDIVVRNDYNQWSEVARALARQVILHRAKSPDFTEAVERFKRMFVLELAS